MPVETLGATVEAVAINEVAAIEGKEDVTGKAEDELGRDGDLDGPSIIAAVLHVKFRGDGCCTAIEVVPDPNWNEEIEDFDALSVTTVVVSGSTCFTSSFDSLCQELLSAVFEVDGEIVVDTTGRSKATSATEEEGIGMLAACL